MKTSEWRTSFGKAFFIRESNEGFLKVSFFGPFYGSYIVFASVLFCPPRFSASIILDSRWGLPT
nr:hypothetical protein [Desulfobacula sp.]